jgi:hypothetical protein
MARRLQPTTGQAGDSTTKIGTGEQPGKILRKDSPAIDPRRGEFLSKLFGKGRPYAAPAAEAGKIPRRFIPPVVLALWVNTP